MFVNVRGLVLEVAKNVEGQALTVGKKNQGDSQRWTVVYSDKAKAIETKGVSEDFGFHIGRPFYIITKMASGRAIEVVGGRNLVLRWKKYNNVA